MAIDNPPISRAVPADIANLLQPQNHPAQANPTLINNAHPHSTKYLLPDAQTAPAPPLVNTDAWQQQLKLAAHDALKIKVTQTGFYRLSGAQLATAGLAPETEVASLQLFTAGQSVTLNVRTEQGKTEGTLGPNGYVEFYGQALDTQITDGNIYWLVSGATKSVRFNAPDATSTSAAPEAMSNTSASFTSLAQRKDRIYNIITTHNVDVENFFGGVVNSTVLEQEIILPDVAPEADYAAILEIGLQGIPQSALHNVRISFNNQEIGVTEYNPDAYQRTRLNVPVANLREGANKLTLQAINGGNDVSALDYWNITYPRRYRALSDRLEFSVAARQSVTVEGFTTPNVRLFDITNPQHIAEVTAHLKPAANGYNLYVQAGMTPRNLLAVTPRHYLTPAALTHNRPSAWTHETQEADFLIIAHETLCAAVAPLAEVRRTQGLQTQIIDVQDIYDEWSGGVAEPKAIKEFLRWTQEKWSIAPRYVLFVGDASADPRDYLGLHQPDLVPSYPVDATAFETVSDEVFGDFNNDNVSEIALGRWPARTPEEVNLFVQKTLNYQPVGDRFGAAFIADRPFGYIFENAQRQAQALVPNDAPSSSLLVRTSFTDAAMRQELLATLNRGPALVNYFGHGYNQAIMSPSIFNTDDARRLTNSRLSVYVIMACLTGQFHDLYSESLAEALLRAPNGGAVAVWASTSLPYASGQPPANRRLVQTLYGAGSAIRLGDAVRQAKLASYDAEVRRCWILFGDPTLFFRNDESH